MGLSIATSWGSAGCKFAGCVRIDSPVARKARFSGEGLEMHTAVCKAREGRFSAISPEFKPSSAAFEGRACLRLEFQG
jgi:hypothetical protein